MFCLVLTIKCFFPCAFSSAIDVIKSNFPEAGASLSIVRPVLVGGISLLQYVQNWPGKGKS